MTDPKLSGDLTVSQFLDGPWLTGNAMEMLLSHKNSKVIQRYIKNKTSPFQGLMTVTTRMGRWLKQDTSGAAKTLSEKKLRDMTKADIRNLFRMIGAMAAKEVVRGTRTGGLGKRATDLVSLLISNIAELDPPKPPTPMQVVGGGIHGSVLTPAEDTILEAKADEKKQEISKEQADELAMKAGELEMKAYALANREKLLVSLLRHWDKPDVEADIAVEEELGLNADMNLCDIDVRTLIGPDEDDAKYIAELSEQAAKFRAQEQEVIKKLEDVRTKNNEAV